MTKRQIRKLILKYEHLIYVHTDLGCDLGCNGESEYSRSHLSCVPILLDQVDRLKAELAALTTNT